MKHLAEQLDTASLRSYVALRNRLVTTLADADRDEDGQATAEYVAVIVLIAAVIGIVINFGDDIGGAIRDAVVAAFDQVRELVVS